MPDKKKTEAAKPDTPKKEIIFESSRVLTTAQLVNVFRESLSTKGSRFCFILGSGASVESKIPTGNQLEMKWMNCLMGIADDDKTPKMKAEDSERLARCLCKEGKLSHDFAEIKKAWEDARKAGKNSLPSEYYFDIYRLRFYTDHSSGYFYLERVMEGKEPSIGYQFLSSIVTADNYWNNLVITTNFDNLMEDALNLYTDKRPLSISHEALADFIHANIQRPVVAKVHRGLMFKPFNSPEETNQLKDEWKIVLNHLFKNYTPIVVGYGGGDGSLMEFLKEETTDLSRGIYWCYIPKFESEKMSDVDGTELKVPNKAIRDFIMDKKGYLVQIDGFDSLMMSLGNALCEEKKLEMITPTSTEQHFMQQAKERSKNYQERWEELQKENKGDPVVKKMAEEESEKAEERAEKKEELTAWDYNRKGDQFYDSGEYEKAIEEYDRAIQENDSIGIFYYNRGAAYDSMDKYKEAIQDYTKAIEINRNFAYAYNNRGFAFGNLGKHEEAIRDYDKAIELKPNHVTAYNNRGFAFSNLGKYEEAIRDYDKAIELNPNYATAYDNRGDTYKALGNLDQAIADYTNAIDLEPDNAIFYRDRAKAYRLRNHEGDIEHAEADERCADELKAADPKNKK